MITRRIARPLSALSPSSWTCLACQTRASILPQRNRLPVYHNGASQIRTIYQPPELIHDEVFSKDGVPDLFSSTGYHIAWRVYQEMMVRKLNELTAGEPFDGMAPKQLVLRFARDPLNASLFNHASMAHNNLLFFETLSPKPTKLKDLPVLQRALTDGFGSIETLRATMLDTANAMFGPGFVWLVWSEGLPAAPTTSMYAGANASSMPNSRGWRVLTTYLAGTPYAEAAGRQQGEDMNTGGNENGGVTNTVGAFGASSGRSGSTRRPLPPGAGPVIPLLCVSTWTHTYIYNYGLPGKRKFLEKWWDAIDWSMVEARMPRQILTPTANSFLNRR